MKNLKFLFFLLSSLLLLTQGANAQQSYIVFCQPPGVSAIPCPAPLTSSAIGNTIAVTNTFQTALVASTWVANPISGAARQGCLIQNNGTNNMFVFFKKVGATASKAASLILTPNGLMNCNSISGGVLQDEIDITGTSGDAYVIISQ